MEIEGFKMIVRCNENFFIQFDKVYSLNKDMSLGVFNFWIEDQCYPGKGINLTLNSINFCLKSNLAGVDNLQNDLGNIDVIEINFNNFDDDRLL